MNNSLILVFMLSVAVTVGVVAGCAVAYIGLFTDARVHLFACAVTVIVLGMLVKAQGHPSYDRAM